MLHHPKKGDTREGQAGRGIGVLNAEVDVVLKMTNVSGPSSDDRRRRIVAYSRFEETPRRLLLELNREGTDYTALPPQAASSHDLTVLDLIHRSDRPVTAAGLRQSWPDETTRPDVTTRRRWLAHLVEQDLIVRIGSGRKSDPWRYGRRGGPRNGVQQRNCFLHGLARVALKKQSRTARRNPSDPAPLGEQLAGVGEVREQVVRAARDQFVAMVPAGLHDDGLRANGPGTLHVERRVADHPHVGRIDWSADVPLGLGQGPPGDVVAVVRARRRSRRTGSGPTAQSAAA